MSIENEAGFLSLADLAALNTDEVETLMNRLPDQGIYLVRGGEVKAAESRDESDSSKPPLFSFTFASEILGAEPLDKSKDPESYVGRSLRDRYTLWPSDFQEAIGLLKGRYKTIGLGNEGQLGGVEGQDPGWLDGITGHVYRVRVRHFDSKNGKRAAFDWLPAEDESADEEAA